MPAPRAVIYRAFADDKGLMRYITQKRMALALSLLSLSTSQVPIGEIAHRVGYSSQQQFSRAFRREYGMTPSVARRQFSTEQHEQAESSDAYSVGSRYRSILDRSKNN